MKYVYHYHAVIRPKNLYGGEPTTHMTGLVRMSAPIVGADEYRVAQELIVNGHNEKIDHLCMESLTFLHTMEDEEDNPNKE